MAADWRRHSNLQCFLNCTTPAVPSQRLHKMCFQELNNLMGNSTDEYFNLGELWDSYYEWSVYGAGVPILLNNRETVVQYYVPYLSGIQIYTNKFFGAPRNVVEDTESDSWSDDSECKKLSRSWDAVSEESVFDQEGSLAMRDRLGHLYFEYFETGSPYGRTPLTDKVNELAQNYPRLTSFNSLELSPPTWMSVAWYPIYHIPTCRNVKELSACFLTYHTISSSFQENVLGDMEEGLCCTDAEKDRQDSKIMRNCISLPPFGLATYKLQGSLWVNHEAGDEERIVSLLTGAESWLKQLQVHHHDFNYFSTRSM